LPITANSTATAMYYDTRHSRLYTAMHRPSGRRITTVAQQLRKDTKRWVPYT